MAENSNFTTETMQENISVTRIDTLVKKGDEIVGSATPLYLYTNEVGETIELAEVQ